MLFNLKIALSIDYHFSRMYLCVLQWLVAKVARYTLRKFHAPSLDNNQVLTGQLNPNRKLTSKYGFEKKKSKSEKKGKNRTKSEGKKRSIGVN